MLEIDNHKEELGFDAQLRIVKEAYPAVGEYIERLEEQQHASSDLPKYDDNDEIISREEEN